MKDVVLFEQRQKPIRPGIGGVLQMIVSPARRERVEQVVIAMQSQSDLLKIVGTFDPPCRLPSGLNCGQNKGDKDPNHRHHHQKFQDRQPPPSRNIRPAPSACDGADSAAGIEQLSHGRKLSLAFETSRRAEFAFSIPMTQIRRNAAATDDQRSLTDQHAVRA